MPDELSVLFPLIQCFPDRFVRREIEGVVVCCSHQQEGCKWEGRLANLEDHLKACEFVSKECPNCGLVLMFEQLELHELACPKALMKCPLAEFGCSAADKLVSCCLTSIILFHPLFSPVEESL